MKYLVSKKAILNFADGTQTELQPGISSFPDEVIKHWAFSAHAQPIDENELEQKDLNGSSAFLEDVIEKLVAENEDLKSQIEEMKVQIEVKADKTLTENNTEKKSGAGNGKKQSSADS
ncbi:hypothetical protein GPY51_21415 [Photorhabdus laumondii subsp. laumondii]|uniref:Uncharacterized protein n=1 Tax=Photorhabdus laumondii subsp. laumondii TaxID=141679 RepID=A0A6L9JUE3_PHOLM|nr:hypothetical protein [Photorhabdus laumondii]MCC8384962.1 hypothetical protein [Photorhabdus laumondii]MCC8413668.1 hypothetical protein [Photorhabdus laumondii]NDK96830.1 hypothetical protein [Photorhabdus laumondii subsp. laumondii]NDL23026.1 hypothetical protein [Photorhabdus laumondii subsp. laumondii]NDL32025.1 hypothetical protein [Photorhabdus laumondii subsp. laumondii]